MPCRPPLMSLSCLWIQMTVQNELRSLNNYLKLTDILRSASSLKPNISNVGGMDSLTFGIDI